MRPKTWSIRLTLRKDPAAEQPPAPKDPTIAEVQDVIQAAVHAKWPWFEARATAQRTDK